MEDEEFLNSLISNISERLYENCYYYLCNYDDSVKGCLTKEDSIKAGAKCYRALFYSGEFNWTEIDKKRGRNITYEIPLF